MAQARDTTAQFERLASDAIDSLSQFFRIAEPAADALGKARVAATVLSAWTRAKQTEGAREATTFMIARELATDKEQLRQYMELSMPSHALIRALPGAV